jgi:ATP-binding cassette subfamily B protein
LPNLGQNIAGLLRQLPARRNVAARLLEPLAAADSEANRAPACDADGALTSGAVALRLRSVTVRAAGRTVLSDINLELGAGDEVAIVGPSGAGKSTLVGLLLGWHRPHAGRVECNGEVLDDALLARLRRRTAWVDPAVQIWNRTLLHNLRYGAEDGNWRGFQASLTDADLIDLLHRSDEGLQTPLGESGGLLSGGEGQRVRLGRAHQNNERSLVILDEAFRGLDRPTRGRLLQVARRKWRDATLICVTHDLRETLDFPRVVVLDQGRIVQMGPPAELLAQEGSLYGRFVAAEDAARNELWSDPRWRHLRLAEGRLVAGETRP